MFRNINNNVGLINSKLMFLIFEELNKELNLNSLNLELTIYDGAVMTLLTDTRPSTRDIDCIFSIDDVSILNTILETISLKFNLSSDWINDDVKEPLKDLISTETISLKKYSNLIITRCSDEQLLAMKILASRSEPSKDFIDSYILCKGMNITTRKQLLDIVSKFVPTTLLGQRQNMFIKYLGEDLGYEW